MFHLITELSVRMVKNYLLSPFVFCILLTLAVFAAAMAIAGQTPVEAAGF